MGLAAVVGIDSVSNRRVVDPSFPLVQLYGLGRACKGESVKLSIKKENVLFTINLTASRSITQPHTWAKGGSRSLTATDFRWSGRRCAAASVSVTLLCPPTRFRLSPSLT